MAQLVKVIDKFKHNGVSMLPDGSVSVLYTIIAWHWQLINTTPDEIAYFCGLMDNE